MVLFMHIMRGVSSVLGVEIIIYKITSYVAWGMTRRFLFIQSLQTESDSPLRWALIWPSGDGKVGVRSYAFRNDDWVGI